MSESDCTTVREHLLGALHADFVGPFDPHANEEVLPIAPSRWYLTGFLAPQAHREPEEAEPPDDGAFDDAPETGVVDDGEQEPEPKPRVTT